MANTDNGGQCSFCIGCSGLQEQLDKEQEWKPVDYIGTNCDQKIYEELAGSACGEELCDEAAKDTLSRLFGFTPERIKIVRGELVPYEN